MNGVLEQNIAGLWEGYCVNNVVVSFCRLGDNHMSRLDDGTCVYCKSYIRFAMCI